MTISDSKNLELEARGTSGSTLIATAAISLALVLAQHDYAKRDIGLNGLRFSHTDGTVSLPSSLEISEMDIFRQISRVYDELLSNQIELDVESRQVLYKNLWDLYV